MDWLLPVRPWKRDKPEVRLVRRLLHERQIKAGAHVLVAGCGDGELLAWLNNRGVKSVGLDWRPESVLAARCEAPASPVKLWRPAQEAPFEQGSIDLVLAFDLPEHAGDLFSPAAVISTANLLSTLRPEGDFVLIHRVAAQRDPEDLHRRACYARHLGCFAGTSRVRSIADSGCRSGGFLTAALQIPDVALSLSHWRGQGLRTLARQPAGAACCDRQIHVPTESTLRAA
jgi:SAM-dependent methyltransferase